MSTLRVNTLQDATGSNQPAMVGAAKAWVNFDGTGTVAIRAAFNVSSITDNNTGNYTVNFTTAMSDANYGVSAGSSDGGAIPILRSFTTSGFVIACNSLAGAGTDSALVCASIFR